MSAAKHCKPRAAAKEGKEDAIVAGKEAWLLPELGQGLSGKGTSR